MSFVLLTAAAKTSSLQIQGTVESNFRPAYDILVRPRGSKTPLERQQALVPPNYLSGIFGGITLRQWREILGIRGVEVAAPVANIGYVIGFGVPQLSLIRYLSSASEQILRLRASWLGHNGHSRYPDPGTGYVYVTRVHATFDIRKGLKEIVGGRTAFPCEGFYSFAGQGGGTPTSPFSRSSGLTCFSIRSPDADGPIYSNSWRGKGVGAAWGVGFPLLLSAIDPTQEARLVQLPRTVVSGRYLRANEDARFVNQCLICNTVIPVLVGARTYVDEPLVVSVERLRMPERGAVLKALQQPSAPRFVASLPGRRVGTKMFSSASMYADALSDWLPTSTANLGRGTGVYGYWSAGSVTYRVLGKDRLRAQPIRNPPTVWRSTNSFGGWLQAPPGSQDLNFRMLVHHDDNQTSCGPLTAHLISVGRFDQRKLPGFSPLSRVPLETYSPPQATPADAATKRILGGHPLGPTMNLSDYVAQPPFMLTTMRAAMRLLGRWVKTPSCVFNERPFIFQNTTFAAPISVIRVRVKDVTGPDDLSLTRIRVVAQKIHDQTGLDVDITAGSSPHPLLVELPAGKFGRPKLLLREGWSKKGVSVSFLRALDRKDLLLFALILLICAFFLSNGALASVRARRAEIGTLRTLGWPGRAIFAVVLGELAFVGLWRGSWGRCSRLCSW